MDLQVTYNEYGSRVKFYRFQTKNSGTTYNSYFGFLAGDYTDCADYFASLDYDEQRSIVEDHADWSIAKPSPFISTTSDLEWAIRVAKKIKRRDPVYIAEISPGRAVSGSIRYYHWCELVRELDADIERKAMNYHETVFLGQIPKEAVTWYGTVEEAERHYFEDDEDSEDSEEEEEEEDSEQEQEEEYEEDEEQKEIYSLSSLMSQLRVIMERADEQEGEEEAEEAEEWYNQLAETDIVDYDSDQYDSDDSDDSSGTEDYDLESEGDVYDLWY